MERTTIFNDFLTDLEVPHTREYSNAQFDKMTFRSLFGFSKLLESYGIPNETLQLGDKDADLSKLTPPFIACTKNGMAIVKAVGYDTCLLQTDTDTVGSETDRRKFVDMWNGVVLLAYPDEKSTEPGYSRHRILGLATAAKKWVLIACVAFVFLYLFVSNGLYSRVSTFLVTLIDIAGIYVTYQLVLKSLNIHTHAGDSICGLLDRTGCRTVLSTKASKFFGLFGWAEVGFAYFGVSLACLLVFPQFTGYLAFINACCCPFSIWSVWYQKYRARTWCTLCLITQACLWAVLFVDICFGMFRGAFPWKIEFFVLIATYVAALLGINALMPAFDKNPEETES